MTASKGATRQRGMSGTSRARRGGKASPGAPQSASGRRGRVVGDSPTLPLLRTSERSAMKHCEWLWERTYVDLLKPQTDMPALRFGSLIHKALAAWYIPGVKRGTHPAETFRIEYALELQRNEEIFGIKTEDEKWVNALPLGVAMLENYVEEYGQDKEWEVIATEMPFQTLVYRETRNGPTTVERVPWFYYVGIIDGVWRNRLSKEIWIPDHKSTAGLGDSKLKYLQVDDQAGAYWSYGVDFLREIGILKKDQQLAGMLYNFLRKSLPDERPSKIVGGKRAYLNKDGSVSKVQPSPYFLRQPIYRDQFDREEAKRRSMIDMSRLEMFRSDTLEITKSPGMFTCPSCAMRDACELHETGNDWQQFLKMTTKKWEPYAEHEVYDGR